MIELNKPVVILAKSVIKQAHLATFTCKDKQVKKDYYKSIRKLAKQSIVAAKDCNNTMHKLITFLEAKAGGNFISYIESNNEPELIARILQQ